MIYIGTSGFSYKDWMEVFYPAGLPQKDWLSYYAREFNTCEINSTYYAIPSPDVFEAMAAKTGENFLFAVKANQEMTHQREDSARICEAFIKSIEYKVPENFEFKYDQDSPQSTVLINTPS